MRLLHIGRATTNEIVISDQTVSRQHAQLIVDDNGQATIVDLGSGNGTFVNGQRISEPRLLDPTDIVKVGEHLLKWRTYLTETMAPKADVPAQVAPHEREYVPSDTPDDVRKPLPWKWIGLGAGALLLVIVLVIMFTGGSAKPKLDGKWRDTEDKDTWIKFGTDGKYTEGYKNAVTYDSATWKAMGVDRILIEKGSLEISRTYKFDDDQLLITQLGETTAYTREEED